MNVLVVHNRDSRAIEQYKWLGNKNSSYTGVKVVLGLLEKKKLDYWFVMYNERSEIVAECSVRAVTDHGIRFYQIDDVLIPEKFRGKKYCPIFIQQVLNFFEEDALPVRVIASTEFLPSLKCYTRVFGAPYKVTDTQSYFVNKKMKK